METERLAVIGIVAAFIALAWGAWLLNRRYGKAAPTVVLLYVGWLLATIAALDDYPGRPSLAAVKAGVGLLLLVAFAVAVRAARRAGIAINKA